MTIENTGPPWENVGSGRIATIENTGKHETPGNAYENAEIQIFGNPRFSDSLDSLDSETGNPTIICFRC